MRILNFKNKIIIKSSKKKKIRKIRWKKSYCRIKTNVNNKKIKYLQKIREIVKNKNTQNPKNPQALGKLNY